MTSTPSIMTGFLMMLFEIFFFVIFTVWPGVLVYLLFLRIYEKQFWNIYNMKKSYDSISWIISIIVMFISGMYIREPATIYMMNLIFGWAV